ncbi:hypothetical protein Emag_003011 [Eimeria magna]
MMKDALKALSDGIWVVVFPEGTRSVTGRLQPFKNGFFRLAAENPDIYILPIAAAAAAAAAKHQVASNLQPQQQRGGGQQQQQQTPAAEAKRNSRGLTTEQLRDKTHDAIFNLMKLSPEFNPLQEQPLTELARVRGHGL